MRTQQLESLKLVECASVYIGRVTDFFSASVITEGGGNRLL